MIRSFLFSIVCTIIVTLGIGFWINDWFLQGYNWSWIAIPSFWVFRQIFYRFFRLLDIAIGVAIVCAIVYFSKHGINIPWV